MSAKAKKKTSNKTTLKKVCSAYGAAEYTLTSNGLTVLLYPQKGSGIITSNILYYAGARDELPGETGLAHMLEHMLFKTTTHDKKNGIDSGAMQFERETGIILNANTWKDRTNYFFSYPKEHLKRALTVESERMRDLLIENVEFLPEQANVLSEFDMYNGDPEFALAVDMVSTAFHGHPYGHETIGYRPDIASYTTEKLTRFYDRFYQPNNAVLMVVGDYNEIELKKLIVELYGKIENTNERVEHVSVTEPVQEGIRRITISRESATNILAIGFKHGGFPSTEWFEAHTLLTLVADGDNSLLYRALVDTGLASHIHFMMEPTRDPNLGILFVSLTKKAIATQVEEQILSLISSLTTQELKKGLKKTIAQLLTDEAKNRTTSIGIVQELSEYVAAKNWQAYFETDQILKHITTKALQARAKQLFTPHNLTIGYFEGTQK